MGRTRTALFALAAIGWTGTLLSQFRASGAGESEARRRWETRRNRFLLLSSLATNTLVLHTVYRVGTRIRAGLGRR